MWEDILKNKEMKVFQRELVRTIVDKAVGPPVIDKRVLMELFYKRLGKVTWAPDRHRIGNYMGVRFRQKHPEYTYHSREQEWRK
jgi:hypothetical protein